MELAKIFLFFFFLNVSMFVCSAAKYEDSEVGQSTMENENVVNENVVNENAENENVVNENVVNENAENENVVNENAENENVVNEGVMNEGVMNVLKSASLEENTKTEKNILYDLSYYMNFLKIISGINSQQMEYEGIINIDNTKRKEKNIKNVNIIYSSKKKYKNNVDDIKKNMNKFVFS
ncbi:conserved Plasmodium protein, unknown function [Plasmodium yoelii]|uniref:PYST-C1-like N-terminal domain-containing protein n=2 Tax=Plasmodium yoelii TaxID=5861 RepID=A0AAF0B3S5_PLAYO|nr:conserved Plasmodium protein, unknown function [Plasmodium yoelii]WBY56025.1 hypothetical protein Py17XNL_000600705 [Plasmodium yoelii yoelii]CDU17007.1 conserved Plasmodium protein, unknown function [Plasmodium yoelii]VTZ75388.1 conserved Plasmodium protein, unknown function [Plasmodium yoelii]|eukprot:XP_022813173.1 conserved Plasmodium protein, unknown function [Plasmodium yoelii]